MIFFWWIFFMLMTVVLAIVSCTFSIIGLCNASKIGTSPPCCPSCSPGCLACGNGFLILIDFIALVFAGVLFGEVMHWIGLFAGCFIFEMIVYIIMIILSAIAVLMLLLKKQSVIDQEIGAAVGGVIEMFHAFVTHVTSQTPIEIQPTQAHVPPQQGVIVQAAPLQQAKTF